jgi:ribonuclease BN (tRNA processing enzyme)
MKVTLLGTGTPAPSLARQSSGYLIEVAGQRIVMDHGPGAHHRLLESGHSAVDVSHVFISHLHYDHCLDYPRLVLQRWDMGADRVPDLEVFGPPPLARTTELLFGEDGVWAPDIRARRGHASSLHVFQQRGGTLPRKRPSPRVREVHAGDVVDGGGWRVRVGHASHVQPFLECLAYRLDADAGSLCYSGDSGGVCEELIELATGCDLLILMNHYLSGSEPYPDYRLAVGNHRDNAVIAKRAGVKRLVLSHFLPALDAPGIRETVLREVRAEFGGEVVWGQDLMSLRIG